MLCSALSIVAAAVLVVASAQDPRPVFRVGAELVVIDLVAAARDGRAVADLEPSEIQVFEDGKPQRVQFVRLVGRGRGAANSAGLAAPVPAGASVGSPRGREESSPADVRVAIVLDLGSMPLDAFPRVRSAVLQLLRDELPAGIPVMLATVTPQVTIHQPFTTDRAALTAAVNGLPPSLAENVTFTRVLDTSEQLCAASRPTRLADSTIAAAKSLIDEADRRVPGAGKVSLVASRWSLVRRSRGLPFDIYIEKSNLKETRRCDS